MTRRLQLLCLLGAVAWLPVAASNRTCYYPDGTESPADSPCSTAETTHCCNSFSVCLSIGYCMSIEEQPYVLSRGSCTSDNWGTGCPTLCSGSDENPGGGRPMTWYGKNSDGDNQYCCGTIISDDDNATCEDGGDPFTLDTATILYGVGILANTTNTTSDASSTSASASASASSDSAATPSTTAATTSGSGASVTAVGAGVGVSLGVLSLTALSWALWERRRRLQQVAALEAQAREYTSGMLLSPGGEPKYDQINVPAELSGAPRQLEMPTH